MIIVKPRYPSDTHCSFCKKKMANKGLELDCNLYYIYNVSHIHGFRHKYSYLDALIKIPQCKDCHKKNDKVDKIMLSLTFLIMIITYSIIFYLNYIHNAFDNIVKYNILISAAETLAIILVIWGPAAIIIRHMIESKVCSKLSDQSEYRPIKKLLNFGFSFSLPNPKSNDIQSNPEPNKELLSSLLEDIATHDNCIITKRP